MNQNLGLTGVFANKYISEIRFRHGSMWQPWRLTAWTPRADFKLQEEFDYTR